MYLYYNKLDTLVISTIGSDALLTNDFQCFFVTLPPKYH